MPSISSIMMKLQLHLMKPFARFSGIEASRLAQDELGRIGAHVLSSRIAYRNVPFENFETAFAVPTACEDEKAAAILYLHGGGYVAGSLDYAKAFGGILAAETNVPALCVAYRLAPENKFPAALEDAFAAYEYLLHSGYAPDNIALAGESAGGGLVYCLLLYLKEKGLPLPACALGISPWVDLTLSGKSYEHNVSRDPSLIRESLAYYVLVYAAGHEDEPLVSPLRGDVTGFPPSLLFAGGDEILLDDVKSMHEKLLSSGCRSDLTVEPGLWHVYPLYGTAEGKRAIRRMVEFLLSELKLAPKTDAAHGA